jgi:hypothetical protein
MNPMSLYLIPTPPRTLSNNVIISWRHSDMPDKSLWNAARHLLKKQLIVGGQFAKNADWHCKMDIFYFCINRITI